MRKAVSTALPDPRSGSVSRSPQRQAAVTDQARLRLRRTPQIRAAEGRTSSSCPIERECERLKLETSVTSCPPTAFATSTASAQRFLLLLTPNGTIRLVASVRERVCPLE
jgi:hypothetical protein